MTAPCTMLDQMAKEIRLRWSLGLLAVIIRKTPSVAYIAMIISS